MAETAKPALAQEGPPAEAAPVSIRSILSQSPTFTQEMFNALLTRPSYNNEGTLAALFHTDIERLLVQLQKEFPEIIKLSSIGNSYQGRPITLMEVDARDFLVKEKMRELGRQRDQFTTFKQELVGHFHGKPAILITGQMHSREVITSSMVLFSLLKMLHGGVLHKNQRDFNLLVQNKYYIIPTINVDGLAFIEDQYLKDGTYYHQRKNLHVDSRADCKLGTQGVDLNRNWGYNFGSGDNSDDMCDQTNHGTQAFSEPETRALKNFLTEKKDELKFVYNFHCAGNQWFIPFNGKFPNVLAEKYQEIAEVFKEIASESKFPESEDIGPSVQNIGIVAGGDAGDWITHELQIPAAEAEIGDWSDYNKMWFPHTPQRAFEIINNNMNWLEHTYEKIGNQISIEPVGYVKQR